MEQDYPFTCSDCGVTKTYTLNPDDVKRWKEGALIQRVFPQIEDREIMISGTCNECFDKMWEEEEDDEEL